MLITWGATENEVLALSSVLLFFVELPSYLGEGRWHLERCRKDARAWYLYLKLLKILMVLGSLSPKRTVFEDKCPADYSMQAIAVGAILYLPYWSGMCLTFWKSAWCETNFLFITLRANILFYLWWNLLFVHAVFSSFFLDLVLRLQTSWGEDLCQHLSNGLHYKSRIAVAVI